MSRSLPLVLLIVFGALAASHISVQWSGAAGRPIGQWLGLFTLAAAFAATLAHLCRRLPTQNVVMIVAITGVAGTGLWMLGLRPEPSFVRLFRVAWLEGTSSAVLSIVVVLTSRDVVEMVLCPWRSSRSYGYCLLGFAALLACVPFVCLGQRAWPDLAVGFGTTVLALLLCVPWYLDKRGQRALAHWSSLLIWLLVIAWLATNDWLSDAVNSRRRKSAGAELAQVRIYEPQIDWIKRLAESQEPRTAVREGIVRSARL